MNKRLIESYRSTNLSRSIVFEDHALMPVITDGNVSGKLLWHDPRHNHFTTPHTIQSYCGGWKVILGFFSSPIFSLFFLHHLAGSSNGCLIQDIGDSFIEYFITCSKIKDCRLLKANYSWCQLPIISLFCSWSDELLQSLLHAACSRVSYVPSLSWAGS